MSTAAAVSAAFNDDSEDEESKDNTEGAIISADASRDVEKKFLPDNIADLELKLEVSYSIGEGVEGLYGRGKEWYKAKVGLVTLEGKYNLLYEDGDIEDNVSIDRIRKIKSVSPKVNTEAQNMRTSATAAAAAAVSVAFNADSEDESNNDNNSKTEVAVTSADVSSDVEKKLSQDNTADLELKLEVSYSIGEDVEGLYGRGKEWYKAKVGLVTLEGKYNLLYEDGDIEDNVSIDRIRKIKSVSPKVNTEAQDMKTAAAVSGDLNVKDESNNNNRNNNSNTEDAVTSADVSRDVEKKLSQDNTANLELEVSYSIGEGVEGLYGRGKEWYKAKISLVTLEGKYNLLYEDGDIEDNVSIERIRKIKSITPKINTVEDSNDSGNRREKLPGTDISVEDKIINSNVNEEDHSSGNSIPLGGVIVADGIVTPTSAVDTIPVSAAEDVTPISSVEINEASTDDKICTDTVQLKDVTTIGSLIKSSGVVTPPEITDPTSNISKGDVENDARTDTNMPTSSIVTDQHHVPLVIAPLLPPTDDNDDNSDPLDKLLKSLSEKTPPVPCFSPPTPTSPMRALGLGTFFAPEQQRQVLSSPTAYKKYANIYIHIHVCIYIHK
jgi:hypothetical protein